MKPILTARSLNANRPGTASVELALVLPLLMLMLFGSLEVGMLVKTSLTLSRLANEAARMAGVGAAPARIDSHLISSATGLNLSHISKVYEYRHRDVSTGSWGAWSPLGTNSGNSANNTAGTGDQVRISFSYPYALLFRGLLAEALHADSTGSINLNANVITVRGLGEYREQ